MWIEVSEEQITALRQQKWRLTQDSKGRVNLVSPRGGMSFLAKDVPVPDGLCLYIVRAAGSSRFKIGISNKPSARLVELQVGSPLKLGFVAILPVFSATLERAAHNLLKEWRAHGEWFDLGTLTGLFIANVQRCRSCVALLNYLGKIAEKNATETSPVPTGAAVGNSLCTEDD
jgi:hypothetical protein